MRLIPLGSRARQSTWNKIQFNGVAGSRTYISFTHIEPRIGQNMKIHAQGKDRRGDWLPLIVTVIVAVVGTAGILYNLGPANDSEGKGNARVVTASAVSRAGAIEIPSGPRPPADANEAVLA
jgi:hypothetical protein